MADQMDRTVELEDQIKLAVRTVMAAEKPTDQQLADVQELVQRKAEQIRAPVSEKIKRIKSLAAA